MLAWTSDGPTVPARVTPSTTSEDISAVARIDHGTFGGVFHFRSLISRRRSPSTVYSRLDRFLRKIDPYNAIARATVLGKSCYGKTPTRRALRNFIPIAGASHQPESPRGVIAAN